MKKIQKKDVVQQNPRNQKLRVAVYCRVSTKFECQKSSIKMQKEYYTKLIVYYDEINKPVFGKHSRHVENNSKFGGKRSGSMF